MNGFIKIWIGCAAALLAAGCGYDDFGEPHPADETAPLPNMSVATLRERCAVGPVAFSGSGVVLSGYVTTSDRADNFYRMLMLEDNSGAVEVCAGLYDLHNDYPVGCRLTLSADGLTAAPKEKTSEVSAYETRTENRLVTACVCDMHRCHRCCVPDPCGQRRVLR